MREPREEATPESRTNELDARDDRSPIAIGYGWVSRVSGVSLEFATLVLLGYWLDVRYSTRPWFMIAGAAVGFVAFATGLASLVKRLQQLEKNEENAGKSEKRD